MMLPPAADLIGVIDLQGIRDLVGIPQAVWTAFIGQVGDPGTSIAFLAALPAFIVSQACSAAQFLMARCSTLSMPRKWGWYGESAAKLCSSRTEVQKKSSST